MSICSYASNTRRPKHGYDALAPREKGKLNALLRKVGFDELTIAGYKELQYKLQGVLSKLAVNSAHCYDPDTEPWLEVETQIKVMNAILDRLLDDDRFIQIMGEIDDKELYNKIVSIETHEERSN